MINKEATYYSLRNLKHRKGRSFLTIFSILVGIATIFVFVSYGYGLYDYTKSFTTSSSADKVLILAKGSGAPGLDDTFKLTDNDINAVKKAGGVYEATGLYYGTVMLKQKNEIKYVFLTSYDPQKPLVIDIFGIDAEKGRLLRKGDKGVVLGYNYLIPGKIFDKQYELNDYIEINDKKLKVIGFMESIGNPQDDSQIYVTNEKFLDILPEKDSYAEIVARVDLEKLDQTISNIEKNLRKERDQEKGKEDFFVQTFDDMIESFSKVLNIIIAFVILIALISVIVSTINTANTMITSVLERYKEIGILKAIGARNSEIFGIFLFESSFLGLVAGCIGVLLGFGITSLSSSILANLGWGFLQPHYSWELFLGCILFALITGAISGVAPAMKASKINPVEVLKYE